MKKPFRTRVRMPRAPKFPKRFSREKRQRLRRKWQIETHRYICEEINRRVWAEFPRVIAESMIALATMKPVGLFSDFGKDE